MARYLATRTDIEVPDGSVVLSIEGKRVTLENPGFARCRLPRGSSTTRLGIFNHERGTVVFKYVHGDIDEHAIAELTAISQALNAELLGPDGAVC